MANHVQTCPYNPTIAQAEEMQVHHTGNENNLIAQNVPKDSLQSPQQESRDSSRITMTVPTVPKCMPRGYQFGSTVWSRRL